MRMAERTLVQVEIAPRVRHVDALGGRMQAFSQECILARASVLPEPGGLDRHESGLVSRERLRVLVPADTAVYPGDRLTAGGADYLVVSTARWQGHIELECEAMA